MASFPALIPNSRAYSPGVYPHTPFASFSGLQNRVRHGNVMLQSRLQLTYVARSESEMLSISDHYKGQYGTFESFSLPSAIWSGALTPADYELNGYLWRYASAPSVVCLQSGIYDINIELETVPPDAAIVGGAESTVAASLTVGTASATSGLAATINISITAGTPITLSAGFTVSIGLGSANGIAAAVTATLIGGAATVQTPPDPLFSSVSLLLHMDGSNGSTTFTDSSANTLTVTANGNAQISTTQSKFGGASGVFDGSGDYLTTTLGSSIGTGDFTIEGWLYRNTAAVGAIACIGDAAASTGMSFYVESFGTLRVISAGAIITEQTTLSTGVWTHVALTRSGIATRVFIDGVPGSSGANASNLGNAIRVGAELNNSSTIRSLNGYLDDLRVTIGIARYTASFTPPTAPFPNS